MWVPQWPLPKEKAEAASQLIAEQLQAGHIRPSTSPWNTPIFVIKKRSGKWRLLHDLRAINAQMQPLGAVQRGMPALSALPKDWPVFVIDLRDCFFSIPLHREDSPRFAFTLPTLNQESPDQRFQWVVLPQGMANSPTMCQLHVAAVLEPVRRKFPKIKCLHYMDDILITGKNRADLEDMLKHLLGALKRARLYVAPEKVQQSEVALYLGARVAQDQITPQKLAIRRDTIHTLNDMQRLVGDINWIRPYIHLSNHDLQPLYEILKGDSDLTSPRRLSPSAEMALNKVEQALTNAALRRITPDKPFIGCVLKTQRQPTAVIWQQGPLLWIHPKMSPAKAIEHYPDAVATLALETCSRAIQHFGTPPNALHVPYTRDQIQTLITCLDSWAILRCTFPGIIDNQMPKDPLLHFITTHPVIFPRSTSSKPIEGAPAVYTDGSKSGVGAYVVAGKQPVSIQFKPDQPQVVELQIVLTVLRQFPGDINIVSDSKYVVNAMQILETAGPIKSSSTVAQLLGQLQILLQKRTAKIYTTHIRAHTNLPGPMSQGNAAADAATRPVWMFAFSTPYEAAQTFHSKFHVNARTLAAHYNIPRSQARDIVRHCPSCATSMPVVPIGVNPRGLRPNHVWQMDVTHISEFGTLKYVHVSVDTYSQILFASAESGERVSHVINHCLAAWAAWGKPKIIKTDNGPAYTSKPFVQFCQQMEVSLKQGIPYNPQGQGIIERSHRTLKDCLNKQKGGIGHGLPPKGRLSLALFTINFLNLNPQGHSPAIEHCDPSPPDKGMVRWKDVLTGQWMGPDPVVSWTRGAVCVFPQVPGREPLWVPERLVRTVNPSTSPEKDTGDDNRDNKLEESPPEGLDE